MSKQLFNQRLESGISLPDMFYFLIWSWKVITISSIIGGVLAAGYAFSLPNKYEAKAYIQVAKVAGIDVETPVTLVEKLKMPMYYSAASHSACNVLNVIEPGVAIANNLNPTLLKLAPIISVSYRANSPEDAVKCLESIVSDIRNAHNLLARPYHQSKNNQLSGLKIKLDAAERVANLFPIQNLNFDFSDPKFSATALLLTTILNKENEIKDLRSQIFDLEISLLEPQTRETYLTTQIHVLAQKVSPRRTFIFMSGLIIGLFVGLFFMIGKHSWLAYKAPN